MVPINNAADFAINTFKILIGVACVSALILLVDKEFAQDELEINVSFLVICNVLVAAFYLLAGIMFVLWFYTAYKKLFEKLAFYDQEY